MTAPALRHWVISAPLIALATYAAFEWRGLTAAAIVYGFGIVAAAALAWEDGR